MRTVFADTGYWIALSNPRDGLHERAKALAVRLAPFRIVTSEMVLAEVLTFASSLGEDARKIAVSIVKHCIDRSEIDIVPQTSKQFRDALDRYTAYSDKKWSLTDCASFLIMEEFSIREALANDKDFEQAGFSALLNE